MYLAAPPQAPAKLVPCQVPVYVAAPSWNPGQRDVRGGCRSRAAVDGDGVGRPDREVQGRAERRAGVRNRRAAAGRRRGGVGRAGGTRPLRPGDPGGDRRSRAAAHRRLLDEMRGDGTGLPGRAGGTDHRGDLALGQRGVVDHEARHRAVEERLGVLVCAAPAGGVPLAVLGADHQVLVDAGDRRAGGERAGLGDPRIEREVRAVPVGHVRRQVRTVIGGDGPRQGVARDDPRPGERVPGRSVEEPAHAKAVPRARVLADVEPEAPRLLHELVALMCRVRVDRLVKRELHEDREVVDVEATRPVRDLDALLLSAVEDDRGIALPVRGGARAPCGLRPDRALLPRAVVAVPRTDPAPPARRCCRNRGR